MNDPLAIRLLWSFTFPWQVTMLRLIVREHHFGVLRLLAPCLSPTGCVTRSGLIDLLSSSLSSFSACSVACVFVLLHVAVPDAILVKPLVSAMAATSLTLSWSAPLFDGGNAVQCEPHHPFAFVSCVCTV